MNGIELATIIVLYVFIIGLATRGDNQERRIAKLEEKARQS